MSTSPALSSGVLRRGDRNHSGHRFRIPAVATAGCSLALLFCLSLTGCGPRSESESTSAATISLAIAGQNLQTEVALSPAEQAKGLMNRDTLPADHAMLFVFEAPRQASFWMRNTRIPLSIAYLDARGVILEVHDMQAYDETPIVSQSQTVSYALEVNQGWFRRHRIAPGDVVRGLEKIPSQR